MATTSFRRKKYGFVKPVKERKIKLTKPDVRELKRYYAAFAKYGIWQKLDSVIYAMNWWDSALTWFNATTPKEELTTTQARKIQAFIAYRKQALSALSDKNKIGSYRSAIQKIETLTDSLKVPKLEPYIKEGEVSAKKHKEILAKMEPRFERITGILARMFPSCPLALVVVPQIIDPVTGKDIGHKIDYTKNTIYYSRKQMQAIRVLWRKQGILAVAIAEAWWLSRAMSWVFGADASRKQLEFFVALMDDFEKWARSKDAPARLARGPKKPKKEDDKGVFAKEAKLLNAEIVETISTPTERIQVN